MTLDDFLGETFSKSNSAGSENEAKGGKGIVLSMWAQEGLVQVGTERLSNANCSNCQLYNFKAPACVSTLDKEVLPMTPAAGCITSD